jgi:hypothetical protein
VSSPAEAIARDGSRELADVHVETDPGYPRWLLARRSLTPNTKGELELASYLCLGPVGTTIEDLARKRRPELTRGSAAGP